MRPSWLRESNSFRPAWFAALLFGAAMLFSLSAAAEPARLAIIIDDLGDRLSAGRAVVELPGPVTCSILPRTPHSHRIAGMAHASGKEVMLHLPMQSVEGNRLGPGGLTLDMTREDLRRTLLADLASVPHAAGVNNHMGSLLTRHPGHMGWLMAELAAAGGLYFVDSRTAERSVALSVADEFGLAATSRDVFLDNERSFSYIAGQFHQAVAIARATGSAIAIGHGYAQTVEALTRLLPQLDRLGVRLVPVSELIRFRNERRIDQWQASLFPSPTDVKNSKR